jgi:multisubunit Na+/H+ antiporter MnhB subunit
MELPFMEESITTVCGGVIAGTFFLWLAGQFSPAISKKETSVPSETASSYCSKRCTLATYDHASITELELSKLQSSPAFLKWLRDNESKVIEREDASHRERLWQALAILALIVVATLVLPFNTFALNEKEPKSLNQLLVETEPLPRKIAALAGLAAVVCSLFASPRNMNGASVAVVGLVVCLIAGDAMQSAGAGFVTLLAAVAARVFLL